MQYFPFDVPVGGRFKLEVKANYFRYYDCTVGAASPTLRVTAIGDGGSDFLIRPGEQMKLPRAVAGFMIENFDAALAINGRILAGEGDFDGAVTLTGAVSVSGAVSANAATLLTQANTDKTVGVAAALMINAAATRKSIWFRSRDTNTGLIAIGGAGLAVGTSALILNPGEKLHVTDEAACAFYAISDIAAQKLDILEGA
jgi:hypothetical protein